MTYKVMCLSKRSPKDQEMKMEESTPLSSRLTLVCCDTPKMQCQCNQQEVRWIYYHNSFSTRFIQELNVYMFNRL